MFVQVTHHLCHHENQQHWNASIEREGVLSALLPLHLVACRVSSTPELLCIYQVADRRPHSQHRDTLQMDTGKQADKDESKNQNK